jgi:hypothetical protein
MGFYKSLLMGTLVSLIIVLAIMGVILGNTAKNQIFPAEYSSCPDYYTINSENSCKINSNIYSNTNPDCMYKDFSSNKYTVAGTGPLSGLCEKKKWANQCGVTWDGITNDSKICYIT